MLTAASVGYMGKNGIHNPKSLLSVRYLIYPFDWTTLSCFSFKVQLSAETVLPLTHCIETIV